MILVSAPPAPEKDVDINLLQWHPDGKVVYASDGRQVGTERSARIARLIVQDHNDGL